MPKHDDELSPAAFRNTLLLTIAATVGLSLGLKLLSDRPAPSFPDPSPSAPPAPRDDSDRSGGEGFEFGEFVPEDSAEDRSAESPLAGTVVFDPETGNFVVNDGFDTHEIPYEQVTGVLDGDLAGTRYLRLRDGQRVEVPNALFDTLPRGLTRRLDYSHSGNVGELGQYAGEEPPPGAPPLPRPLELGGE